MNMQTNFPIETDNKLTPQEEAELIACEKQIQEFLFEYRKVNAALIAIREKRLFRKYSFSTFENYVKAQWPAIFGDFSRMRIWQVLEHERTVQAIEASDVNESLQNGIPTEWQTRPMNALPIQDRPYAYALAVEANNGERPTGSQVQAIVQALQPDPTNERIGRLDTDRKAKPAPIAPSQFTRKSFRVSEFKFDHEAQKVHFQVYKPGNTFKGWEPRTERLSITLDDLVWELRNIGFCLVPIGENMPAAEPGDTTESPTDPGLMPDERINLSDGIPRDLAGRPMSPKMTAYWQDRGYFQEFNLDDAETEPGLPQHSADADLLAKRPLAGRSIHQGGSGTGSTTNGTHPATREGGTRSEEVDEDDEPLPGPFWTPDNHAMGDSALAAFFPVEDTPQ